MEEDAHTMSDLGLLLSLSQQIAIMAYYGGIKVKNRLISVRKRL